MGNFQGDLLKCLNISWNDPETCAKALFDGKMAEIMGKHPKAVQNPSKYDEFLASRSGSHPKWPLTLKHQVSYLITLKTAFQNILPCLNIPEFIVFLLKLNCGFPKKIKRKKPFFPLICTLFAKNRLFATWPPFLNRRLLINGSFSRIVTFHMINVKRVVLWLLFWPYGCVLHSRFIIRRQSHTGFFLLQRRKYFVFAFQFDLILKKGLSGKSKQATSCQTLFDSIFVVTKNAWSQYVYVIWPLFHRKMSGQLFES